jgi:hypothetical protein
LSKTLRLDLVSFFYNLLEMSEKVETEILKKISLKAGNFRAKFFYFFLGVGLSNLIMFNKTYYFCDNRIKVLNRKLEEIKKEIAFENKN